MKSKVLTILLISSTFLLSGCGPSACDCAVLLKANYNRGLFFKNGMTESDKKKTQQCMDKYDGYLNAEKKCND